jgi:hypothetical protein
MTDYIVVRPRFDTATEYSYEWCQQIIDHLKEKGLPYIELAERDAVRKKVEEALTQNPNAMLIHYDHGDQDRLIGNDGRPVVDLQNVSLLSSRQAYNMNCLSAKILGVEAHNKKCTAYWGYTQVFSFTTDALDTFKTFANCGFFLYMETRSWKEALSKAKELGKQLVNKLIQEGKIIASSCMSADVDALVCWNTETPTIPCRFRALAVKLFGALGWKLTRKHALSLLLFAVGFGISLHDFAHQVWELKGTPLSLEGGYIGFILMLIGFLGVTWETINWMKKT